jgi:hypothetical protein
LDDGIRDAAAILLVVSKASMASPSVKDEWMTSVLMDKRIILILFEPCKLDPELEGLEWVDFTRDFDQAMGQLVGLLERSLQIVTSMPPIRLISPPGAAMKFIVLSILLVVISASGGCLAALIPIAAPENSGGAQFHNVLNHVVDLSILFVWLPTSLSFAWLPLQFLRRTYNAQRISNALNGLLFSILLLLVIAFSTILPGELFSQEIIIQLFTCCNSPSLLIAIVTCIYLKRLLLSEEMYRWSGPSGALIRMTRPDLTGHTANEIRLRVAVEFASQDRLYAQELKASIAAAGHDCTDDPHNADIVLPLLSAYKTDSVCDPETTRLFPIMIQSCDVAQRLSRVQWVDLRYGKVSMDAVANLLDEPSELLRILGVVPVRTTILPNAIKWLSGLLSILLTFHLIIDLFLVAFAFLTVPSTPSDELIDIFIFLIGVFIILSGIYLLRHFVIHRKLRYLSFLSYWWAVGFSILLVVLELYVRGLTFAWPLCLVTLLMLRKEVKIWLPAHVKKANKISLQEGAST